MTIWKKISFSVLVALFVIAGSIFFQTRSRAEVENTVDAASAQTAGVAAGFAAPGIPTHLSIPAIGVDADIQETGLAKDGTSLGVPTNCTDVAWYDKGPRPGLPGSAVIDGHVECRTMPEAVFYSIGDLKAGDRLEVTDDKGVVRTFEVTGKKTYSYDDTDTTDIFAGDATSAHLNLITCAGTWMPDKKLYDERIVVFTKLVK